MPGAGRAAGRHWRLASGLLLAAGFAWLFARELDWESVGRAFGGVSPGALGIGVLFLFGSWTLRIVRWWWLLRAAAPGLPFTACVGPFLVGMAVNNLLPLRAGDALRVAGFGRQLRSPVMRVAGTLVIERVLDVVVLTGVFFFCLLGVPEGYFSGEVIAGAVLLAGLSGASAFAVALFPLQLELLSQRLAARAAARRDVFAPEPSSPGNGTRSSATPLAAAGGGSPGQSAAPEDRVAPSRLEVGKGRARRLFRWPPAARLLAAASRHGTHFGESLRALRSRSQTLGLFGISGLAWFCEGSMFFVVAAAIEPGSAPAGPWLAAAIGTLSTVLPGSPGHLGTFHYFAAQGLAAYGAAPAEAAAFALTAHALLWTTSTAFGLVFLLRAAGIGGLFGKASPRGGPTPEAVRGGHSLADPDANQVG